MHPARKTYGKRGGSGTDKTIDSGYSVVEQISLCEALDRILNKGIVIGGEVTISIANVDLLYLGLRVILTSVETWRLNTMDVDG